MNTDKLILSFSGGAGLFSILLGAGAELNTLLSIWAPEREVVYAGVEHLERLTLDNSLLLCPGVSSGCLPAMLLALGYTTPEQMTEVFMDFAKRFDAANKRPGASELFRQWQLYLMAMLTPDDKWKTLSGRLFIGVSVWNNDSRQLEPRVISQFDSAEAVAEAVLTSAHLFILGLWPTRSFKGKYAADGGWTMRYVELPARYGTTIPVCYDSMAEHIEHLDRAVDFSTAKYTELFRLGQQMVRQQQHYYLSLVWFGAPSQNGDDGDDEDDEEMPPPSHHHHHRNEPMVSKLDTVSLSLISGIAVTAAVGTLVFAGHSLKQLGSGVARFFSGMLGSGRTDDDGAEAADARNGPLLPARAPFTRLVREAAR